MTAAAGLVAAAALVALPTPVQAATVTTVAPGSLTTTAGGTGGQPVSALGVKDQSGTTDTWTKYIEFGGQSAGVAYSGYADYPVPASIPAASVTALQVLVNYRGPATATQTWGWDLFNWATSSWTRVGTNAAAPDWGAWTSLTFTATGAAPNYLSGAGVVRVRLTSSNAADNADIDYQAVVVTSGTTPPDTTAPSTPTGPKVSGTTSSSVSLTWSASTDNVGVTGYEVFQGAGTAPVASVTGTAATVSGLAASTSYTFTVKARDAAGNRSPASSPVTATTAAVNPPTVTLPLANGVFDYQIGGSYAPASAVAIVDRDRSSAIAAGKYNICYINAFQTQPGELSSWPASVLLRNASGQLVGDPDWPGEYLLDTSTAAKRSAIAAVVQPWMSDCATKGFAAIEPDNLDSWTRSGRLLTQAANVAMAQLFVSRAHALGLAIAQKNTPELASIGRAQIGFDFAIVEECQVYGECGQFTSGYGTQVYEIEYTDNGGSANFNAACSARGATVSVTYRDRNVVPLGTSGYVFASC